MSIGASLSVVSSGLDCLTATYIVMAYAVMAYVVMAPIVVAYIVMAYGLSSLLRSTA